MSEKTINKVPNVPNLRFNNECWMLTSLGFSCDGFDYGIAAEAKEFDGINQYIRITDIDDDSSSYTSRNSVSPSFLDENCVCIENDILFARTGASTGKTYLYNRNDGKLYFAGFLIRANVKPIFDPYFVFTMTKTSRYANWIKIMSARSGQPGINAQEYKTFSFYHPSLKTQNKISKFIKNIDKRIQTQSKIIEDLKLLKFRLIDSLIGENIPNCIFENLYNFASEGGTPSTSKMQYYENGTIPFVKIDDLKEKYLQENRDYITEDGLSNSSAWLIPTNSIIYSNGATIGKLSINTYPIATKQGILGIIPSKLVIPEYMYYFMQSKYFRKEVHKITVKGTMDCAYLKDLSKIKCYIPSIKEQEKDIDILNCLDEKIKIEYILIKKYKEQKKFLLSNMFI